MNTVSVGPISVGVSVFEGCKDYLGNSDIHNSELDDMDRVLLIQRCGVLGQVVKSVDFESLAQNLCAF